MEYGRVGLGATELEEYFESWDGGCLYGMEGFCWEPSSIQGNEVWMGSAF